MPVGAFIVSLELVLYSTVPGETVLWLEELFI